MEAETKDAKKIVKLLIKAIKYINPYCGDPEYYIVDLLNKCVKSSYRTEAGGAKFREDMHKAHGYQFFVQFALTLPALPHNQATKSIDPKTPPEKDHSLREVVSRQEDPSLQSLSPTLSRLLDVIVNMAQTGLQSSRRKGSKSSHTCIEKEQGNCKVKDLEAVRMLVHIFLKADRRELQAEVLYRIFEIISSHTENYKLCQELELVPLLTQNIDGLPPSLQEIIFAILEHAVTVVNCIPEQELPSLCCLLQKPITSKLKQSILCFFVKRLSFDQLYKKVPREVGLVDVLIDDLKHYKFLLGPDQHSANPNQHRDSIISSMFENEGTTSLAWGCLFSLVQKADANQQLFRWYNGVTIILPFLVSNIHRTGVLRILSCLITEDVTQAHPEELVHSLKF